MGMVGYGGGGVCQMPDLGLRIFIEKLIPKIHPGRRILGLCYLQFYQPFPIIPRHTELRNTDRNEMELKQQLMCQPNPWNKQEFSEFTGG